MDSTLEFATSIPDESVFCRKCGEKTRPHDAMWLDKFCRVTGKRFYQVQYKCPNKRHWWDRHESHFETNDYTNPFAWGD